MLNDNLVDVYSAVLEPPHYNPVRHDQLVRNAERNIQSLLGLEEKVQSLLEFYQKHKNDAPAVQEKIQHMQDEMVKALSKRGVPFIHNGSMKSIQKEVESVPFDPEARLFFYSTLAELIHSCKYGRLRLDDPPSDDTHDQAYAGTLLKESLTGRFLQDWTCLGQAIAWYTGKQKVEVEDLKSAFVYTTARRLKPEEEFFQKVLSEPRKLPVRMECARQIIERTWENYAALTEKRGFQQVRKAIRILNQEESGNLAEAKQILEQVDHPLGKMVLEVIR